MSRTPAIARELLEGLQKTLTAVGIDYQGTVLAFGQVAASERRERGGIFTLRDHVRGLVLSQLSNQRPWGPIARNMDRITQVFLDFEPQALESAAPQDLVSGLTGIRCGNRSLAKQMQGLGENIRTLRRIDHQFGSLDEFVTSSDPDGIARRLATPGAFKLRQVGYTLALEYLRNVGVRAAKPDVHIRRVISGGRLDYCEGHPSEEQAQRLVAELARSAPCNATYLDNLLWLFCAKDYGNVCGAQPRCDVCLLRPKCNHPGPGS